MQRLLVYIMQLRKNKVLCLRKSPWIYPSIQKKEKKSMKWWWCQQGLHHLFTYKHKKQQEFLLPSSLITFYLKSLWFRLAGTNGSWLEKFALNFSICGWSSKQIPNCDIYFFSHTSNHYLKIDYEKNNNFLILTCYRKPICY